MDDYNDTRGMPPVDYETAEADAIAEAMPLLRLKALAKEVLSSYSYEHVEQVIANDLWEIADTHASRTDLSHDPAGEFYDTLINYKLEPTA